MRRAILVLLALGLALTVFAIPVTAAPPGYRAVIHETFERRASAEPCVFDEADETLSCPGTGHVQGYGRVSSLIVFWPDGDTIRTLTFADGSTLVIAEFWGTDESGPPGGSGDSNRSDKSWGWPFFDFGSWAVIGGTGMFDGATGSGVSENVQSGDTIVLRFTGSITP